MLRAPLNSTRRASRALRPAARVDRTRARDQHPRGRERHVATSRPSSRSCTSSDARKREKVSSTPYGGFRTRTGRAGGGAGTGRRVDRRARAAADPRRAHTSITGVAAIVGVYALVLALGDPPGRCLARGAPAWGLALFALASVGARSPARWACCCSSARCRPSAARGAARGVCGAGRGRLTRRPPAVARRGAGRHRRRPGDRRRADRGLRLARDLRLPGAARRRRRPRLLGGTERRRAAAERGRYAAPAVSGRDARRDGGLVVARGPRARPERRGASCEPAPAASGPPPRRAGAAVRRAPLRPTARDRRGAPASAGTRRAAAGRRPAADARPATELAGPSVADALAALALTAAAFTAVLFLLVLELVAGFAISPLRAALGVSSCRSPRSPPRRSRPRRGRGRSRRAAAAPAARRRSLSCPRRGSPGRSSRSCSPAPAWASRCRLRGRAAARARRRRRRARASSRATSASSLVLAILAPVATARLDSADRHAILQGTALVLDAHSTRCRSSGRARLLADIDTESPRARCRTRSRPARRVRRRAAVYNRLAPRLDDVLVVAVQDAFQIVYLIAAALALLGGAMLSRAGAGPDAGSRPPSRWRPSRSTRSKAATGRRRP